MNKVANKIRLICGMFLWVCEGLAFPFNSYDIVSTNENWIIDYPPHIFEQLCLLPHQAGVCDLICTGLVFSQPWQSTLIDMSPPCNVTLSAWIQS